MISSINHLQLVDVKMTSQALLVTKQSQDIISGALADQYDMGFVAKETIQCYQN